jgi:hypothetical protein
LPLQSIAFRQTIAPVISQPQGMNRIELKLL